MNFTQRILGSIQLASRKGRAFALGALSLAVCGDSAAQLSTLQGSYDLSVASGTYTPLVGGEVSYSYTPPGVAGFFGTTYNNVFYYPDPGLLNGLANNSADPFLASGYPLPFPFTFNGVTWDRVAFAKAGYISFGSSSLAIPVWMPQHGGSEIFNSATTPFSSGTTAYARGEVLEQRSRVGFAHTGGPWGKSPGVMLIKVGVQGTAPNRTYVVQYENFETGNAAMTGNFQIRLSEGGGNPNNQTVSIAFGSFTWPTTVPTAIGLAGSTNADWFTLEGTFAAPTLGASNSATMSLGGANVPTSGLTYTWTPKTTACVPQATVPVSELKPTSATIQWVDNGASSHDYEVRAQDVSGMGADGLPGSGGAVASGNVPTGTFNVSVTGLTSNTTYYAYVRSTCSATGAWSLAGKFTTPLDCGASFNFSAATGTYGDHSVTRICPTTAGQAAVATFSSLTLADWNSDRQTSLYVYNGPSTSGDQLYNGAAAAGPTGAIYYIPSGGLRAGATPPTVVSSHPSGCLTFKLVSFQGASWNAAVTCEALPTCFPPSGVSATTTGPQGGSFTWTGTSPEHQYRIVANGSPATAPALAEGISATVPVSVTDGDLVGGTTYTLYVRGICSPGDTSAWTNAYNFTTAPGCGGPFNNAGYNVLVNYPINTDATYTICPNVGGDVVTVAFTDFSVGSGDRFYVFDGPNTSAGMLASSTAGVGAFPSGGYTGTALPGPFTSTHPGGCLTFRLRANGQSDGFGIGSEHGFLGNVTCGPAPACSVPNSVTMSSVGGNSAEVSWVGGGSSYIVEYGAPGFTPGTGATAGSGSSTVVTNVTSPYTITGLSPTTNYKVVVRQACSGPTYSTNSFPVNFVTSIDCSTATVLACGELATITAVFGAEGNPAYALGNYSNASCTGNIVGAQGVEKLYRITAPEAGNFQLNIPVNNFTSYGQAAYMIAPVSSGCGAAAFSCIGTGLSQVNGSGIGIPSTINFTLPAAGDYYVLADLYTSSQGTQQFQVFCPGLAPCVPAPTFPVNNASIAAGSATPINFSWPAAFGATGYDVYFQGGLVASNHPSTTINGAAYTPANIATLYGVGTTVTWRVVPRNSYGVSDCTTEFTFRVGGDGAANAIPLTNGVASGGSNRAVAGYSNLNTAAGYWGRDVFHSFTTSACADAVDIELCLGAWIDQNYPIFEVRRIADNVVVGSSLGTMNTGQCRTLNLNNVAIDPNTGYYLIVDAYAGQYEFTIEYNEVLSTADADEDGLLDCVDGCPNTPGEEGSPCYAGPLFGSAVVNGDCECEGQDPIPCSNDLTLEFQTDGNPNETTWELVEQGTDFVVQQGGPLNPAFGVETNMTCLPDGCFYLRVLDAAGDGMTTGGYILRNSGDNTRIIDNRNNFSSGSVSQISGTQGFCLPIGTDKLIYSSCDKLDWVNNKFIVASANPVVSAQFGVTNATSGYEFWFFDPNGSYSYRRFRSHATSDGFGTGATRACHFKVNGWINTPSTPHLPNNVLLNVRVRGREAGDNLEFGPACQFKLDPALAACPRVSLQDDPANTSDFSCGVSRNFGGSGNANNRIYAKPPQPVPAVASSAVRYQFRFRIPGENICIVRPPQTSAQLTLNWTTGTPLQCSKTYEVDVRVSLNGGASWCFGPATTSQAAACGDPEAWGKVCNVTINPCATVNGGSNSMVVDGNGSLTIYPNPNRGDQLFLSMSNVEEGVNVVNVDIFDMTGKRVMARTIAVQDGSVNTAMELNNELSNGMYLVNFTAGTKAYTERLVIQH